MISMPFIQKISSPSNVYFLALLLLGIGLSVPTLAGPENSNEQQETNTKKDNASKKGAAKEKSQEQVQEDIASLLSPYTPSALEIDGAILIGSESKIPHCVPGYGPGHPNYRSPLGEVLFSYQAEASADGLDTLIQRALYRQRNNIHQCYYELLRSNPAVGGTIVLPIQIVKEKVVLGSKALVKGQLLDLQNCVFAMIPKLYFPRVDNASIVLIYTFQPLKQ